MRSRAALLAALVTLTACGSAARPLAFRIAVPHVTVPPPTTTTVVPTTTTTTTTTTAPPPPPPSGDLPPVIGRVSTNEPVVYVTIDDGWTRDPAVLSFLQWTHWPVTLFLISKAAAGDPKYFQALQAAGASIEDHTIDHPHLADLSYDDQVNQICEGRARLGWMFSSVPWLLRPPYGSMGPDTTRAAQACGIRDVVQWNATMSNGNLQVVGGRLRPGSIVLMHFDPDLVTNLVTLLHILDDAHLGVGRLEDALAPHA